MGLHVCIHGALAMHTAVLRGTSLTSLQALLLKARQLPRLPKADKVAANRVMGCTAQVWAMAALDAQGRVQLAGDSDSELTRGLCAVLVEGLSGLTPEEVLQVRAPAGWWFAVHLWDARQAWTGLVMPLSWIHRELGPPGRAAAQYWLDL